MTGILWGAAVDGLCRLGLSKRTRWRALGFDRLEPCPRASG